MKETKKTRILKFVNLLTLPLCPRMASLSLLFWLILPHLMLLLSVEENIQNQPCPTSFLCGKLGWLTFPFNNNSQPLCGLYPINCTGPTPKIQLRKGGYWFQILNISQTNSIFINDTDLLPKRNSTNCESFASLALPENSIISNVSTSDSLTIFNCSSYDTNYSAYVTCGDYELYYNNTIKTSPPRCSIVRLPTSRLDIHTNPRCYSCLLKGSRCVSDERSGIKCSGVSKGKFLADSIFFFIFLLIN